MKMKMLSNISPFLNCHLMMSVTKLMSPYSLTLVVSRVGSLTNLLLINY